MLSRKIKSNFDHFYTSPRHANNLYHKHDCKKMKKKTHNWVSMDVLVRMFIVQSGEGGQRILNMEGHAFSPSYDLAPLSSWERETTCWQERGGRGGRRGRWSSVNHSILSGWDLARVIICRTFPSSLKCCSPPSPFRSPSSPPPKKKYVDDKSHGKYFSYLIYTCKFNHRINNSSEATGWSSYWFSRTQADAGCYTFPYLTPSCLTKAGSILPV